LIGVTRKEKDGNSRVIGQVTTQQFWQSKGFPECKPDQHPAAILFLLLAFFLLYPIIMVLIKSFRGPSGFTL